MRSDTETVAHIAGLIKRVADLKRCYHGTCNGRLAGCAEGIVVVGGIAHTVLLPLCKEHLEEAGIGLA